MKDIIKDICDLIIKDGYTSILIAGNGASGKSTFAKTLQNELLNKSKTARIISTDDFLLDSEYRRKTIKTYLDKNGLSKESYLSTSFAESYDWDSLKSEVTKQIANITIIEGVGAAFLADWCKNSYKVFLITDKDIEYKRRLQRARNQADLSKERFLSRYEQFESFVLPMAEKFDLKLFSKDDYSYEASNSI